MNSKVYRVYNKRAELIEESIHIIFDESNDGGLSSSSVQELKLNWYNDEEEEKEVRAKSNVEHKEPPSDSIPENDMPPTREESIAINEEEPSPSDPNELTVHEPKEGYKQVISSTR